MPIETIEVKQTQTFLKKLLSLVVKGTEVILTQGNTPIARLVPLLHHLPRRVSLDCILTQFGSATISMNPRGLGGLCGLLYMS